jgi:hypothetical protein
MAITGFTGQRLGTLQTQGLTNSVAVTIEPPAGADFVLIEIHQHDARITFDGTNPTTTVGFKLTKDTPFKVDVGQDTTLKLIAIENSPNAYWQAFKTKKDNDA